MTFRKMILGAVALLTLAALGYAVYLDLFGYRASKIEADLCGGYRLRQQDSDGLVTLLQCSRTKVGKPFPKHARWAMVDPNAKFTLSGMDELCRPGTQPRDMGGKLACMPYQ
jgi:hypothetical protein